MQSPRLPDGRRAALSASVCDRHAAARTARCTHAPRTVLCACLVAALARSANAARVLHNARA
eukprot:11270433-Heterocapsa_arctica.AAC.1